MTQAPADTAGTSTRSDPRGEALRDERPWGDFERLTWNEPSTVKVITVKPGCRLSLQRHDHRDELWSVLDEGLYVEIDGERRDVRPGDKLWIPRGTSHRLGNSGAAPARILEVAFGVFDEDDIERLDDDYSR